MCIRDRNNINQRVVKLIEKTASSKSAFSKSTGISTVILSHISSGRNKVSLTAVEQILNAYPSVNAEWLLLGKGQIFKDGIDQDATAELILQLDKMDEELKRTHKSLNNQLSQIRNTLDEVSSARQ